MCDCLQISKSGFYGWHGRAPSKRSLANAVLLAQIEAAHTMSDATYGMPHVRAELADQGVRASRKRIATVMRIAHIHGVSRRRSYVVTTTRDKRQRPAPDLVERQFVATDINQLWVADMTCVPTWAGVPYLGIEAWYNPHRHHSNFGQISPINFERLNTQKKEDAKTQKQASKLCE